MKNKKKLISRSAITAELLLCITLCMSCVYTFGKQASAKTIEIEKGQTYQLKLKIGSKVKCSNKKIAKVSKKGKIKALKKGKCTIKVIKGKKVKKYCISVKNARRKSVQSPAPTITPDNQPQNTASPTKRPPVGYMLFTGMAVDKIEQKDDRLSTVCAVCEKPVSGIISEEKFQNGVKYIQFDTLSSNILQKEIALDDKVTIGFDIGLIRINIIGNTVVLDGEGLVGIQKEK
ncbi:MAG: hypothetical protein HFH14_07165 [Lachnospiraceae bacterium]|nr:hypothetical protein [Lachnospiraceae bacterium]